MTSPQVSEGSARPHKQSLRHHWDLVFINVGWFRLRIDDLFLRRDLQVDDTEFSTAMHFLQQSAIFAKMIQEAVAAQHTSYLSRLIWHSSGPTSPTLTLDDVSVVDFETFLDVLIPLPECALSLYHSRSTV